MISCMIPKGIAFSLATFAALVLSLFISFPADAQVVGANLSGIVRDASGAVMSNANVSIKNVATGVTRVLTTDAAGFYSAPNLLPGNYDVTTSAQGFSTRIQTGITLTVGAQQVLNITMQVGQVTEKVEVTGEAPAVELATSSLGAVVNSTTVAELPLNGRSWADLATLQPGVTAIETQADFASGAHRGNRGFEDQITVAGARPQWNNYRLDGISMNDYSNAGSGSVLGGNLGVDAIQEFSVITSNYSAEYGRTAGGVVNAITRSGTNEFHGSVYEFLRNNDLDARNFFDVTIPPFRRNQFGADAGGPIRKDKVFVFGDYEGIRQSKGITALETVPSAALRNGMLCSAPSSPSACTPSTVTVDPSVQKYLPFWPLPNAGLQPGSNGDIGLSNHPYQQVVSENFFTARVDNKLSNKDSLDATYLFDFTSLSTPASLNDTVFESKTNRQIATVEESHIFSTTLVNSARIGYSREGTTVNATLSAINPLAKDTSLGAIPGFTAAGVNVTGLTSFSGGLGTTGGTVIFWNSYQGYDDTFWTHGTHSLKFGGGVERIQDNLTSVGTGGIFTFSTLSDFLTNVPHKFQYKGAETVNGYRQTIFGLYAQDDWRVRPNLMLNMGLRWEMSTVPTDNHDRLAYLINITDPAPHIGPLFSSNPTLRNFEPRVGFSWDPFQNGKTAVRGGFGMFDVLPLPYQYANAIDQDSPFGGNSGSANNIPPGSFYTGGFPLLIPSAQAEAYIQQNAHRSYIMQWNLNVQRELPGRVTAVVSYVGSRGVHLPFKSDEVDTVIPISTSAGYLYPSPVGSGQKLNPNYGQIGGIFYGENSSYNSLQTGIQKAMSHGLQVQGSFTWGKSLDTGSAASHGDQYTNSIAALPFYNFKLLRGLSDFNIGRTFVINGIWQVPYPKSLWGPAKWITNGWALGAIYKASDGVPFTPTFGTDGDPLGTNSSTPYDFPNRLGGPGCQSLINPGNVTNYVKTQCFAIPTAPSLAFYTANCDPTFGTFPQCFNLRGNAGRNILIGPGLSNMDFSVYKDNYIKHVSETFHVQFRAEFFNILNRPNFSFPSSTDIFDAAGQPNPVVGLITTTTTTSREIQFALKAIW
jgi:Carboxypeptidase regulatory-like domain/TonB-dependent Receptor Plug Domain/TonB dependent receptor